MATHFHHVAIDHRDGRKDQFAEKRIICADERKVVRNRQAEEPHGAQRAIEDIAASRQDRGRRIRAREKIVRLGRAILGALPSVRELAIRRSACPLSSAHACSQ